VSSENEDLLRAAEAALAAGDWPKAQRSFEAALERQPTAEGLLGLGAASEQEEVRAAELIGALCLATDLGTELPFEHGLRSTLVAMRLAERVGLDVESAAQTYYGCLLFHAGCTADAGTAAELFDEGALVTHFTPAMFGTRGQAVTGIVRALAGAEGAPAMRAVRVAGKLPMAIRARPRVFAAGCEVAQMLSERLGMSASVRGLLAHLTERWDGKGQPGRLRGEEIPLPLRIAQVARDATLQQLVGGSQFAAEVIRARAGAAFDPAVAALLADEATDILSLDGGRSAWDEVLAAEPASASVLRGQAIDDALAALGDFADLASPYLVGHAAGVARLAGAAAKRLGLSPADVVTVRRAALVHDVGRVAVSARIWHRAGPLTPDDWERVRLHAYHSERVLCRSAFLAGLVPVATAHHERLDGSGYHRAATAAALPRLARVLAAADAYHAMTEPRPHRAAMPPARAADLLGREAKAGRLDADSVAAVLEAAGHAAPALPRPAGLTEREAQVVALLGRGMQTKQVARALGISAKTADHHVQNAYAKIGVSTRAAAALFAMRHGLLAWGELPMVPPHHRS
jgi:HD-GYP domain-containing protein (c-di-GMP phosphodiesterase class II)